MNLAKRLSETRRARGFTINQLASKIGSVPIAIERWESGEAGPDCDELCALADALSVSTDHLCGRKNDAFSIEENKTNLRLTVTKYILVGLAVIALFLGGFFVGAEIKLKKEKATVLLPEVVTVTNVNFALKGDNLHFQFMPSVMGEGYSYKITFRNYQDEEFTYDVPLSSSGCFGTALDLDSKFIDTVTVTVGATHENRIIMVAKNLQLSGNSISWEPAE